jgi:hypothetical protein
MSRHTPSSRISRRLILHGLSAGLIGTAATALPGCSLGVMFGKMVMGDPLSPAEFRTMTKEDLTKGKKTVLVICTAPDSVDSDNSTLGYDLIDGITRRLKLRGVKVINPDLVASWIDEHGDNNAHPVRLARDFDTDYIISVDVQAFSFREPNSPKLLRGQSSGVIRVFEINEVDGHPLASTVFITEFKSTYPEHQPVAEQGRSSMMFQKEYMDRVCDQLAEKFYDHRPGTGF